MINNVEDGPEMKSVMLSIKPEYCALIENGKKTIEVRKTRPKIEPPFRCYIYCTKGKTVKGETFAGDKFEMIYKGCGKVIGEFVCDGITKFIPVSSAVDGIKHYYGLSEYGLSQTCLDMQDLVAYGNWKNLYGWHISDLKIYDEPKPLSSFRGMCKYMDRDCCACPYYNYNAMDCAGRTIALAPQSWFYVEERE